MISVTEAWFALVGTLVMVLAVIAGGASAMTEDTDREVWTPDTPELAADAADGSPAAILNGESYDRLGAALDAAEPGDEIELAGHFEERVTVDTPNVTLRAADGANFRPRLDGGGEGTVLTINATGVTVEGLWVGDSGTQRSEEHAGMLVRGDDATIQNNRIADVTFGIWVSSATDVIIADNEISGDADRSRNQRGNGIHLFEADGATVEHNDVRTVRDGIYYQWSSDVVATDNSLWDLRYGVHYMYSDDNVLSGNLAFGNDVGFALMISQNLTITDNLVVDNRQGASQHGILVKDIDDSEISGNEIVGNGNGLYVYNAHDNVIEDNLVMENHVGIHFTAGSSGERVVNNTFMHNDRSAHATQTAHLSDWNATDRGNYWSDARTIDLDGDGASEVRHRPAGTLEDLLRAHPGAEAFSESPAFDAVRLAESSFPILEGSGVVDHHPLTEPPHDHWRQYYEDHD